MTLTTAIEAAERAARDELASITRDMEALAERAKKVRTDTDRLTALRDEGKRVEHAIRTGHEALARGEGERMDVSGGAQTTVDTEHMERVRVARGDVVSIQTRGMG